MDLSTQAVLSIAALLALNTGMVRLEMLRDRAVLFWGVQGLNLVVALYLMVRGLPGYDFIPIISWVLALWLVLRTAMNHRWWMGRRRDDGRDEDVERRASAIREALREPKDPTS